MWFGVSSPENSQQFTAMSYRKYERTQKQVQSWVKVWVQWIKTTSLCIWDSQDCRWDGFIIGFTVVLNEFGFGSPCRLDNRHYNNTEASIIKMGDFFTNIILKPSSMLIAARWLVSEKQWIFKLRKCWLTTSVFVILLTGLHCHKQFLLRNRFLLLNSQGIMEGVNSALCWFNGDAFIHYSHK